MATVNHLIQAFEQRTHACSADLQRYLDLVWSHRKDQRTGTVAAGHADVYGLYGRIATHPGSIADLCSFLDQLPGLAHLPEFQCTLQDDMGVFLRDTYGATPTASGFMTMPAHELANLAADARQHDDLARFMAGSFCHFRRNLAAASDRIYLRLKPRAGLTVMRHIIATMLLQPLVHPGLSNAKVAAPGGEDRADGIVMYLANPAAVTTALREIARFQALAGNRALFEQGSTRGTQAITEFGGTALVGVSTGAEPPFDVVIHQGRRFYVDQASSFGSFRAKLIDFALTQTLQAGGGKDRFVALALRYFSDAGIDPRQPHMHGSTPQTRRRIRDLANRMQARGGVAPN